MRQKTFKIVKIGHGKKGEKLVPTLSIILSRSENQTYFSIRTWINAFPFTHCNSWTYFFRITILFCISWTALLYICSIFQLQSVFWNWTRLPFFGTEFGIFEKGITPTWSSEMNKLTSQSTENGAKELVHSRASNRPFHSLNGFKIPWTCWTYFCSRRCFTHDMIFKLGAMWYDSIS